MQRKEAFATIPLVENILSDRTLQNITGQIVVGQAVLVAYDIGLFKVLTTGPFSISGLVKLLNLKERSVQAMISCACSMKLVEYSKNLYQLSQLGRNFFDENSPTYYGYLFDLLIQQNEIMNFKKIKDAILSGSSQVDNGQGIFSKNNSIGSTKKFIQAIHHKAIAPSFYWTNLFDLNESTDFIDMAGGSGIHTIAACIKNPHLKGIVCDRKIVLPYTIEYIMNFGLQHKIKTKELDILNDTFPLGDTFFFADIFHDWNKDKCSVLAKKCYDSIPSKGRMILHEMLFNEDKTGPMLTAAYNMKMLLWTEGSQYSFLEIRDLLEEVGFRNIIKIKALGNWSLIVGHKR